MAKLRARRREIIHARRTEDGNKAISELLDWVVGGTMRGPCWPQWIISGSVVAARGCAKTKHD
eukprot:7375039-Pyramimonas_sp.AAC.1